MAIGYDHERLIECLNNWRNMDWIADDEDNHPHYIVAYETTLGYGGPEEGGWWYDNQSVLAFAYVGSDNMGVGVEIANMFRDIYQGDYEDRPNKSSTASGACDLVITWTANTPTDLPEEKPVFQ